MDEKGYEYALGHGKTALVIEKNPIYLKMLVQMLEGYGYNVETAITSSEGARIYQETRPDLVILSHYMPLPMELADANLYRSCYYWSRASLTSPDMTRDETSSVYRHSPYQLLKEFEAKWGLKKSIDELLEEDEELYKYLFC